MQEDEGRLIGSVHRPGHLTCADAFHCGRVDHEDLQDFLVWKFVVLKLGARHHRESASAAFFLALSLVTAMNDVVAVDSFALRAHLLPVPMHRDRR